MQDGSHECMNEKAPSEDANAPSPSKFQSHQEILQHNFNKEYEMQNEERSRPFKDKSKIEMKRQNI